MKISKSALDKILSSVVPLNGAQILYKAMKKPTVMLLFSGSCCDPCICIHFYGFICLLVSGLESNFDVTMNQF